MASAVAAWKRKKLNRLGKCDVCKIVDAIYNCPRCEAMTCSLACVKSHKTQLDCDGVRVRTKFVASDKMNEHTLLSDYRLLEDISRCVEISEHLRNTIETSQPTIPSGPGQNSNARMTIPIKQTKKDGERNETKLAIGQTSKNKEAQINNLRTACTEPAKKKSNLKRSRVKTKAKSSSEASQIVSKSSILIARANRVRNRILQKTTKIKATTTTTAENNQAIKVIHPTTTTTTSSEMQPLLPETKQGSQVPERAEEMVMELQSSDSKEENTESTNLSVQPVTKSKAKFSGTIQRKKNMKRNLLTIMRRGGKRKEMALENLKKVALNRSIVLSVLPHKFLKHYENTTFYMPTENCIYWRISVSFMNANFHTLSLNECAETMTLEGLIKGCLKRSKAYSRKKKVDDPLNLYRKMGMSKITVLMTAEKLPNSYKKFYELELAKTLQENFAGKCIVEYPHLCVALQNCFVTSAVKEDIAYNFFENDKYEEDIRSSKEDEKFQKTMAKKSQSNKWKNADAGRESGELTDSDSYSDSDDSDTSDEELFRESEFRSIYADLLKDFDTGTM